jgi:dolichyldiphosphatase
MNGKGYGMPSSHAQFVSFFAVALSLFLLLRHTPPPKPNSSFTSPHRPLTYSERLILSGVAIFCAAMVALSRIYLNYHTPKQAAAGCAAGVFSAVAWFLLTTWLRRSNWLLYLLDTQALRLFRIRDLVVEEDLVVAGWLRWEEKRSKRDSNIEIDVKKQS